MGDHIIAGAKLWVFIFDDIVAMRTSGQDPLGFVLVQHFHVLLDQHLGNVFVAGSAGDIAVAGFFRAQNGEVHPQRAKLALQVAPDAPVTQDALAQILLDRGDVKQAIRLLEQAVEKAPNDPQIRYHWAQALARNGETALARQELDRILGRGKRFAGDSEARALLEDLSRGSE